MAYNLTNHPESLKAMDRLIKKKKWKTKRILTLSGVAALIILILTGYYFTSGKSKLNVDGERLTIGEVRTGAFQEYIPVNGIVLPLTTIYLDAVEGGRVEERFVEDGAIMKKGQPILRLSNTDLQLGLVTQQTNVYNLLTQMQISKNAAQQNTVSKLNQLADVESQFKEAERIYELNKKLYDEKVVSRQEFLKTKNEYEYLLEKRKLSKQILSQDSVSNRQQLDQARQLYEGSQNALKVMNQKVEDLVVRAPVDGQLTSVDAEVGQSKNKGERLGQIDVIGGYKVRADIDEHYISRIFHGLKGEFDYNNKTYKLIIKKVYSQVNNGRFQVDMEFEQEVPEGVRRGQSLQIRLTLSDQTSAILLPKGAFFQQKGGNWIFKLSDNGKKAYKANIRIGRQNPDYYEILEGLHAGDKVITSNYENFGEANELILNND